MSSINRRDFIACASAILSTGALGRPVRSLLSPERVLDSVLAPPTAADYIQDGLVAMWDGIENVGWGMHDSSERTVWRDLVGRHDMEIMGEVPDVVFDDTSFVSHNQKYGTLNLDYLLLGADAYTIEALGFLDNDADRDALIFQIRKQGAGYCNIFRYNNAIYTGPDNLFTPSIPYGFFPRVLHVVSMCSTTEAKVFVNGILFNHSEGDFSYHIEAIGNNNVNKFNASGWGWNPDDMTGSNWSGNIYGARVYGRMLTEDEVWHNYCIDRERFAL